MPTRPVSSAGRPPAGGTVHHLGVVRDQHDGEPSVLAPSSVDEAQGGRVPTGTKHPLCGVQQGAHLSVAIGRPANRLTLSPEKRNYGWERTRIDTLHGAQTWAGYGILARLVKISSLAR
jgi:hypothetical protein